METLKLAMGSDHAGFECKEELKGWLSEKGIEVMDFGTYSADSVDYADFIHPTAEAVEKGQVPLGIIICGSGNGAAITANKHQSIRAALCWTAELAQLARAHNDANILSIPARFVSTDEVHAMVQAFLETPFEGGRHEQRIKKIPVSCC